MEYKEDNDKQYRNMKLCFSKCSWHNRGAAGGLAERANSCKCKLRRDLSVSYRLRRDLSLLSLPTPHSVVDPGGGPQLGTEALEPSVPTPGARSTGRWALTHCHAVDNGPLFLKKLVGQNVSSSYSFKINISNFWPCNFASNNTH